MKGRKTQIIKAALDIISREGVQNCTTRNLAAKVGITEPALYRHFNNKAHILREVCRYDIEFVHEQLGQILEEKLSPVEKLRRVFFTFCDYFIDNPSSSALIFSEETFRDQKELSEMILNTMHKRQEVLIRIIEEGQKSGEIVHGFNARYLAFMFQGSLRLLVTRWRLSQYNFHLKKEGEQVLNVLLQLWRSNKKGENK